MSITDDDHPSVTVRFEQSTYTVAESDDTSTTEVTENEVEVKVILSADPERTVIIPLQPSQQGGITSADYSTFPVVLQFKAGEEEKTFTFSATHDTVDDDGESVKLTFGDLPAQVAEGTTTETVVSITDDDKPTSLTVNFGAATYTAAEGGTATVKVTLNEDPEQTITVPISAAGQDGASDSDYSGVPANVTFNAGETEKTITFTAVNDTVDDDDESPSSSASAPCRPPLPAYRRAGPPTRRSSPSPTTTTRQSA